MLGRVWSIWCAAWRYWSCLIHAWHPCFEYAARSGRPACPKLGIHWKAQTKLQNRCSGRFHVAVNLGKPTNSPLKFFQQETLLLVYNESNVVYFRYACAKTSTEQIEEDDCLQQQSSVAWPAVVVVLDVECCISSQASVASNALFPLRWRKALWSTQQKASELL